MNHVAPAPARTHADRVHSPDSLVHALGEMLSLARAEGFHVRVETRSGTAYGLLPLPGLNRFVVTRGDDVLTDTGAIAFGDGRLTVWRAQGGEWLSESTPIERMSMQVRTAY